MAIQMTYFNGIDNSNHFLKIFFCSSSINKQSEALGSDAFSDNSNKIMAMNKYLNKIKHHHLLRDENYYDTQSYACPLICNILTLLYQVRTELIIKTCKNETNINIIYETSCFAGRYYTDKPMDVNFQLEVCKFCKASLIPH